MSITKDDLAEILVQAGLDAVACFKVIKIVEEVEQEKKEEKGNNGPKAKNKYVILFRTDDDEIKKAITETEAFLVKTSESVDANEVPKLMLRAAVEQNANVKRKGKIDKWNEWCRYVKGKYRKPYQVQPCSKEPVQIVILDTESIPFNKQ